MRRPVILAAVVCVLLALGVSAAMPEADVDAQARAKTFPRSSIPTASFVYPLKVSRDGRYLVDQRGRPFLIAGDSPQSLIGNLPPAEAAAFIADRKAAGFNSLLVDLLCVKYTGCRDDGTTIDGIKPFTTQGDLSTPNPEYFARADAIIRLAAKAGMVVFLDPIETGGWMDTLRANGVAKDFAYGQYVGRRYASFPNIVWSNGNDHQNWRNAEDDAVVLAVARGIQSVDRGHIQTVELSWPVSSSLDDQRWRPIIGLDAAYTYDATYAEVLKEYGRKDHKPVFMVEAGYEFEQNRPEFSPGTPDVLRRQEYWTALSGSTGQFYGNHYTWGFADGWKEHLDTPGSFQFGLLMKLLADRPWFRLVPDRAHKLVTAGYGKFDPSVNPESSDYLTAAATPDRKLAIAYLPNGGKITVDMARLAGRVTGRWYDPASGKYSPVQGSPFAGSGKVTLDAPGKNADGDPDWVLVLTA
jgi:hypothetical protein